MTAWRRSTTQPPARPTRLLPALLLAGCLLPGAAPPAASQTLEAPNDPVVYEVSALDGKLLHRLPAGDERVAEGDRLAGGAELRTGWLSSADLAVPRAAARFHLESRTHVRLGVEDPSVLLVLDRGRLRALFDKLGELAGGEEEERRVETPSAVLAVRGTAYGVAVGRNGGTTLVVFEGVVAVTPLTTVTGAPGTPVLVRAGEAIHVRSGQPTGAPRHHGLTPRDWDRGAMPAMSGPPAGAGDPGRGAGSTGPGTEPGVGPEQQTHQGQHGPPPQSTSSGGGTSGSQGPSQSQAQPPEQAPGPGPEQGPGPAADPGPETGSATGSGAGPAPSPSPSPEPSPAPGPSPIPSPTPGPNPGTGPNAAPAPPPSTPSGPPPTAPSGPPPDDAERVS